MRKAHIIIFCCAPKDNICAFLIFGVCNLWLYYLNGIRNNIASLLLYISINFCKFTNNSVSYIRNY